MPFDHNDHYHRLLLRQVPPGCRTALDVGCGTGNFARRLARQGIQVDAIDPAAEVIAAARSIADGGGPRPDFRPADVTTIDLPDGRYDFISCLASLHHMPFGTVAKLRDALAPGGVLAVLGCYPAETWSDWALSHAAVPANAAARLTVYAAERLRPTGAEAQPGRSPVRAPVRPPTMPLSEIRREASELLPGATIRRLLCWRYLLIHRA